MACLYLLGHRHWDEKAVMHGVHGLVVYNDENQDFYMAPYRLAQIISV
jgi:hypothetical protein